MLPAEKQHRRVDHVLAKFPTRSTTPKPLIHKRKTLAAAEQDSGTGNLGTSVEEMLTQLHLTGDDTQVSRGR